MRGTSLSRKRSRRDLLWSLKIKRSMFMLTSINRSRLKCWTRKRQMRMMKTKKTMTRTKMMRKKMNRLFPEVRTI